MPPIPLLSVVLPAYNEQASIEKVVIDHWLVLQTLKGIATDWEIVVVDDASRDDTFQILEALQKRIPQLRVFRNTNNLGIFGAFARCYAEARGTHIYSTGSDGQWPAENLVPMATRVVAGADAVIGVRTNRREVYSLARRIVSFGFNALPKWLFGVDVQDAGGVKLGTRLIFESGLISTSPFVEAERIIRAHYSGLRIEFVPIRFLVRAGGKAKGASWRNIRSSLRDVVRCAATYGFRRKPGSLHPPSRDGVVRL
jgi:glycosyltransferase involved in cell wall biosynthesis